MLNLARQRGFNVVEAMVTLVVLGILIAAGLPSMADWMRSTHVRNMAETMQSGLHKARMEAMRRNQAVTFWLVSPATAVAPDDTCALAADSGAWVVSLDDPTGNCAEEPSPTVSPRIVETYGPGQGAVGITVAGRADDGATAATSVSFNGYGQTLRQVGQLATVDITHADETTRRLRVEISDSGSIRMCDREVAAPDLRACN